MTQELEGALAALIAECDAANAAAVQRFGGVVIDFGVLSAAHRALDGSVSFCGGWPNVLKPLLWQAPVALDWSESVNSSTT